MSVWAIIVIAMSALNFCGCGLSFLLGILGLPLWFLSSLTGIVVATLELGRIKRGESPAGGKTVTMIGLCWCIANMLISVVAGISSAALFAAYFSQQ